MSVINEASRLHPDTCDKLLLNRGCVISYVEEVDYRLVCTCWMWTPSLTNPTIDTFLIRILFTKKVARPCIPHYARLHGLIAWAKNLYRQKNWLKQKEEKCTDKNLMVWAGLEPAMFNATQDRKRCSLPTEPKAPSTMWMISTHSLVQLLYKVHYYLCTEFHEEWVYLTLPSSP